MKTLTRMVLAGLVTMMASSGLTWGQTPQGNCASTGGDANIPITGYHDDTSANTDPVSMGRGTFVLTRTDLALPGPMPIAFTRTSSSDQQGYAWALGVNWDDTFHKRMTFGLGGVTYYPGNGSGIPLYFDVKNLSGQWTGTHATTKQRPKLVMTKDASTGLWLITDNAGKTDYFENYGAIGAIVKSVDRHGNELDYTYDGGHFWTGNLTKVEDPASGRYMTLTYDSNNHLSTLTDPAGRIVTYTYTAGSGSVFYLSSVTLPMTADFPSGTTETYGYSTDSDLTTVTDCKGNQVISNVYGSPAPGTHQNRVVSQTFNGNTATFAYTDTGTFTNDVYTLTHMHTTYTDYKHFVTDYDSDGNGNITEKVVHTAGLHAGEPATYETDYVFGDGSSPGTGPVPVSDGVKLAPQDNFYKIKQTDPSGNVTKWTYDDNGNVLTMTRLIPTGSSVDSSKGTQVTSETTTYTYEPLYNQVKTVTDPKGNVTTYDYGTATSNPTANLLGIIYPTTAAGTAHEYFTYNATGQVLTHTTADGIVTQNTYDTTADDLQTGYLLKTVKDYGGTGHLNATTQFTYDAYGNVATAKDPNGNTITTTYNALDKIIEVQGASSEVEQRQYDQNGLVTVDQKQSPGSDWQKVVNNYDGAQELISSYAYTSGTAYLETDYTYDANGNRITVTDPRGKTITTTYDERDKPYLVQDQSGHTTQQDFDGDGNTIKLTDELSHVTTYTYDGFDKLEQKTFPDSSYQTWKYDANGNVTGLRTTAGNSITQTYDTRNRMLTQNYGATIANVYDIMGRLLTTTEDGTSLTYVYDNLGRNTSFTDQAGRTSTYTYDLDGNRLNSTYPTTLVVKRAYDASNRLSTIKDGSNATLATYSYDILDRPTGVSLANSTSVAYGCDLLSRVSYVHNTFGGTTTRNYGYVYDNASRVTSTTEPRGTVASGYTDRNEVNSITEPSGSPFADQTFVYDAGFNRSSWTLGSSTTSYTANNLNQYTAISGTTAPTWNTDGGLAAYAGNTYTYDALQRVTEIDYSSGKTLFTYDPLGRRVKKVDENGSGTVLSTVAYHYDGSSVAVEYQPSSVTWTYFAGLMRTDGTNKQWYYRDGHGSVSAVADNSGSVLEQYEYNMQGQVHIANGSGTGLTTSGIANDILYCGYRYDNETGNYFCNARYYNPQLGRFISRDPLSGAEFSQGTNLYTYCGNNYLNSSDPTGMCSKDGKLSAYGYYQDDELTTALSTNDPKYDGPESWGDFFTSLGEANEAVNATFWFLFLDEGPGGLERGVEGGLTALEQREIEQIADKYDTTIDVVGSRARGEGNNINTDLPVGHDPVLERSDIDFRIDTSHAAAQDIIDELNGVGNGAGSASMKYDINGTSGPMIRFTPAPKD